MMKRLIAIAAILLACGPVFGAWEGDGTADLTVSAAPVTHIGEQQDFSLSLWFKTSYSGGTQYAAHAQRAGTPLNESYGVGLESSGTIIMRISDSVGVLSWTSDTGGYNDGDWHHVAVTFDRNANATVYVDGSADGTYDISSAGGIIPFSGTLSFYIGKQYSSTGRFTGEIDQVVLWTGLLSEYDIKLLYLSRLELMPLQCSTTIREWWFLDNSGGSADGATVRALNGSTATGTNGYFVGGVLPYQ